MTKEILIADLPNLLMEIFRMWWQPEEATLAEKSLPEAEQVQIFLRWCKEPGNMTWELPKEEKEFLEKN